MTVFWDFAIALVLLPVGTSETLVNFYQTTRRDIPEDSYLQHWGPALAVSLLMRLLVP
jgi:hypothetical protein